MSTLGIVTARSGSKGLKDKNIRLLNGKPLMAYAVESALASRYITEVMVSTDSADYADIAKKYGAVVPFLRSAENSTDAARTIDIVAEVLAGYGELGKSFDDIIVLQPTSPLRTTADIDRAFSVFYEKGADSVVSVCECEHSPLLANTLPEDLGMYHFIDDTRLGRRQDLERYYRLNGAIYISKVQVLMKTRTFYGRRSYAYVMEQSRSVDIDTELDLLSAEFLMRRRMQGDRREIDVCDHVPLCAEDRTEQISAPKGTGSGGL